MLLRQQGRALVVHTPAKLNLFLEILGKRPDGYHELETLMVTVGLYDTLRFTEDDSSATPTPIASAMSAVAEPSDIHLRCRWAGSPEFSPGPLPSGSDNLVMRAALLLREVTGTRRGVSIELTKRIPLAAGLAGGSSDCAATLLALNRLWKLDLSDQRLLELAARLGSDIPFFLTEAPAAVCRGRGELIEPVTTPMRLHCVIAKPASGLSTAAVFRQCRVAASPQSVQPLLSALRAGRHAEAATQLHNALQLPAEQLNADVARLHQLFSRLPFLGHQMSGSGTSYFGICSHREQAQALAAQVRLAGGDQVFVASIQP
ncbi:MAG: 4-(cytidine 5'-diphospho)-2-C-methyl-D-erythritol kinase [Planctomycetaceae bacterium]